MTVSLIGRWTYRAGRYISLKNKGFNLVQRRFNILSLFSVIIHHVGAGDFPLEGWLKLLLGPP